VTTRRKLLASFLGAGAALAYPIGVEPRWFDLTTKRVRLSRVKVVQPMRILHLADLHASAVVSLKMIEEAIELGMAQRPDLVCLTGDFVTHRADAPAAADYVRVLRRVVANGAQAFAVMGNHDGGRWSARTGGWADHVMVDRILEDSGIELLHNRSRVVEVSGQKLVLAGTGDYWAREVEPGLAFRGVDERRPVVLLAHNPDTKELCSPYCWDLQLSGHTHGGQVIVPLYGPPFRSVEDMRYLSGLKPWGTRQIHVTRGVGNLLGVRLNCRPEVSLLEVG
jgi:predicted MPP superfamily phosphohydrolase